MVAGSADRKRQIARMFGVCERMMTAIAQDLLSVLPASAKARLSGTGKFILIEVSQGGDTIEAILPEGRRYQVAPASSGAPPRDAARRWLVALRVPDSLILATLLRLPRGAAARLDEVVATNISIWTPFAADALYVKARIAEPASRRPEGTRMPTCSLDLRCVPKAAIEPWLATLAERSLSVDELWLGPDSSFSVPLPSPKRRRMQRRRQIIAALIGLAVAQSVVLASLIRAHQDDAIAALETRLDRLRDSLHARAIRQQNANALAATLAAIRARATGPDSMTHALARLAAVLPAGASYGALNMVFGTGGSLTIRTHAPIDPVAIVAATGFLSVTEVNELGNPREGEHLYSVAFRLSPAKAASD